MNPFYLHYALRLPSTLEQFRKWSTGSSYPAILDSDVKKTVIPLPDIGTQDAIAAKVVMALRERARIIHQADAAWATTLAGITSNLCGHQHGDTSDLSQYQDDLEIHSLAAVLEVLKELPPLTTDNGGNNGSPDEDLFAGL